jgi:hypothetical protein
MTLPTNASKANLDSATDDPKLARPDLADLVDKFNDLLTHLNLSTITSGPASIPLSVANGGTGAATAAAARTNLGVEDATESAAGRIEIATQTESNNGTDDTRALTPAKLANISPASVTYSTSDQILILDASDSNKLKRATVTTGKVLQQVAATSSSRATTTGVTPIDDTIPQNTEGGEFLTCSITPSNTNNILLIEFNGQFETNGNAYTIVALHQDSAADAIAAVVEFMVSGDQAPVTLRHRMTAGTTSATTFKVRAGTNTGVTLAINSYVGSRVLGGVSSTIMTITEIAA